MLEVQTSESGTRARTRAAIIDAAIDALSLDSTTSLAEIAQRAEVGRSTLHRYFPERSDLVRAVARAAFGRVEDAIQRADPDRGSVSEALRRIIDAQLESGPIMIFVYSDPTALAEASRLQEADESGEDPLERLFERAARELDPSLPIAWMGKVFWSLLYAGWETKKDGSMSRQEIVDAVMTTITRGIFSSRS